MVLRLWTVDGKYTCICYELSDDLLAYTCICIAMSNTSTVVLFNSLFNAINA